MAETELERPIQGIGGPFVTVAAFCERILQEKDNVHTLVRVIDRVYIEPSKEQLPEGTTEGIPTSFAVVIKSGDFRGPATLVIKLRHPSGRYADKTISSPIVLKGGEHGVNVNVRMVIAVEELGLHWADVELDGRLLTRSPLWIERRSMPAPGSVPADDAG